VSPEEIALNIFTLKVVHGHREAGVPVEDWYREQARAAFLAADMFLSVADAPPDTGELHMACLRREGFGPNTPRT
jgi:hypothetical protein